MRQKKTCIREYGVNIFFWCLHLKLRSEFIKYLVEKFLSLCKFGSEAIFIMEKVLLR